MGVKKSGGVGFRALDAVELERQCVMLAELVRERLKKFEETGDEVVFEQLKVVEGLVVNANAVLG
jgi:hypothetical protein